MRVEWTAASGRFHRGVPEARWMCKGIIFYINNIEGCCQYIL